jgi:peptide-methionine (R)-S-oxide reductase
MNRRTMLATLIGGGTGLVVWRNARAAADPPAPAAPPKLVTVMEYSDSGAALGLKEVPKVTRTDKEWRQQLRPVEFEVTRHADTEIPFTGATWNLHEKGLFRCVCCGTALFDSATKFESGTGWPSFWAPLDTHNIVETVDASLAEIRTAVACRLCDAHLGHVFRDGPKPTGLRYCMNSAAMRFVKG